MITIIDLQAELAKLMMLRGRTPATSSAEREGSGARLAPYQDGSIFASKFAGTGAWERHPQGVELVHILDGAATLEIVSGEGPTQSFAVGAGTILVVPKGAWHRFLSAEGVTLMTATPLPSEHVRVDIDDPRTL